jgi:hypothetical protein
MYYKTVSRKKEKKTGFEKKCEKTHKNHDPTKGAYKVKDTNDPNEETRQNNKKSTEKKKVVVFKSVNWKLKRKQQQLKIKGHRIRCCVEQPTQAKKNRKK